jgi:hypothetical protein
MVGLKLREADERAQTRDGRLDGAVAEGSREAGTEVKKA